MSLPARLVAILAALVCLAPPARVVPLAAWQDDGDGRIVAIGDVHGAASGLRSILRAAGLIGDNDTWTGGKTHLVQTGDITDRGRDVRQVLDLLMRLQEDARKAGGRVDVLLGNHESMHILRDRRDVSPDAYAAFVDDRSERRRTSALDAYVSAARRSGVRVDRVAWLKEHPPGAVEYAEAFGPSGQYGRWIRRNRVMLTAGGTLFMHAGVPPEETGALDDINRRVERDIRTWDDIVATLERHRLTTPLFELQEIVQAAQLEIGRIVTAQQSGTPPADYVTPELVNALKRISGLEKWPLIASDGPLWYRGLSTLPESRQADIDRLMAHFGVERFVIGHTPQPGRITPRFRGRVVQIDTGMLNTFFKNGQPSALEIRGGRLTAIYTSGREPLSAASAPAPPFSPPRVWASMNAH